MRGRGEGVQGEEKINVNRKDGGEGSVIFAYINIAGVHVVRPKDSGVQQQSDTVAVIWRQREAEGGEEER